MKRLVRALALVVLAGVTLASGAAVAAAQDPSSSAGPQVALDQTAFPPGTRVTLVFSGFQAQAVTFAVCGNDAARGSQDCNQVQSQTDRLNADGSPTARYFYVYDPPTTCPCVIRVSSPTNDEVVIKPIDLIGHPVGPIVRPHGISPLQVSVQAVKAHQGFFGSLRSALGGPTTYVVTATVRNTTGEPFDRVALTGAASHRLGPDTGGLSFGGAKALGPGEVRTVTVRSQLPAPVIGGYTWSVTGSGVGPAATASATTHRLPWLLLLLLLVLVVDIVVLLYRRLAGRRTGEPVEPVEPVEAAPVLAGAPL